MSNGTAALRLITSDPPPTPVPTSDMAAEIGEVVADLVVQFGQGLIDFESTGAMALSTKWRAGDLFAKLYGLQEAAAGKLDFAAAMYRQGQIVLARRFSAAVRRQLCPDLDPAQLDAVHREAIGWVDDILTKVTRDERARAH
jgi:hypothetical protein